MENDAQALLKFWSIPNMNEAQILQSEFQKMFM